MVELYELCNTTIIELNKDLKIAARLGQRSRVIWLKESIHLLEEEEIYYLEKKEHHEKELNSLQERCKQCDRKIYASRTTNLPTIEDRG